MQQSNNDGISSGTANNDKNTSVIKARLKKRPHHLHQSKNIEELIEALSDIDIDVTQLVFEFVKPRTEVGIIVSGSIANGIGTSVSDLDIIVLLTSLRSVKKNKDQIVGNKVNYLPHSDDRKMEVSMFISGVEIDIYFIANPQIPAFFDPGNEHMLRDIVNPEDHFQMRFFGRLQNSWVVKNPELVELWKRYYELDKFRINRITTEFTAASKNLEDMHASIGQGIGCVGVLGASIMTKSFKALLAYNGFCFISGKWMRKVNQYIETAQPPMKKLLVTGQKLMFPGLLDTVEKERAYFKEVSAFVRALRLTLSQEVVIEQILNNVVFDLDLAV